MTRRALAAAACFLALTAGAAGAASWTTPFAAAVSALSPALETEMSGRSWHPGCPVPLSQLRLVTLTYFGFDGGTHTGRLVVNEAATGAIVSVFRRLYGARFPIRRMEPVDRYRGDDFASIEADNTSAFNCRPVSGSTRWSLHAYGLAVDVDPIENPYVYANGTTSHPASRPYLDRSRRRPGMAYEGGTLVAAFDRVGWGWGGRFTGDRDYQHFSSTGG